jgi:hypothetical protein
MPKYKVYTEWTGYSVVTVEADNAQDAEDKVYCGDYLEENAQHTGNGLDYGYDHEETIEVREIA